MIIDATNLVLGRLASFAAKKALLGEQVDIVNCEKAYITGSKDNIIKRYLQKTKMGTPSKGPFMHRSPHRLVRRTIRGMLPYKSYNGKRAFKRIMCHLGVPEEFNGKKLETIKSAHADKSVIVKRITLKEVSMLIGGKR